MATSREEKPPSGASNTPWRNLRSDLWGNLGERVEDKTRGRSVGDEPTHRSGRGKP